MTLIEEIRNEAFERRFSKFCNKEKIIDTIKKAAADGYESIMVWLVGVDGEASKIGDWEYAEKVAALLDKWLGPGFEYAYDGLIGLEISWSLD